MYDRDRKWILYAIADRWLRNRIHLSEEAKRHGHRVIDRPVRAIDELADRSRTWDMLVVDKLDATLVAALRKMSASLRPTIVSFDARKAEGLNVIRVKDVPDLERVISFHFGCNPEAETPVRT